jgi:hypothetical protein
MSWASDLDCCGPCGRKRLIAADFSKRSIDKHRADPSAKLRCKHCVEQAAEEERGKAASTAGGVTPAADGQTEEHVCSACSNSLPATAFTRAQLNKAAGKQRCQSCVAGAERAAADAPSAKQADNLRSAEAALRKAEATGSVGDKLKAAATHAALEAERVTGLKPVVLGRGRSQGRGSWRGRAR